MNLGIGLDPSLGLGFQAQEDMSRTIAQSGYTELWTPDHSGDDPFLTCAVRWRASLDVVPGGLTTGVGVSALAPRSPLQLAQSAGTMSKLTGGRFVLGVGIGGAYRGEYRAAFGLRQASMLELIRDYVSAIKELQAGDEVNVATKSFALRRAKLNVTEPVRTPLYLGVLGPEMLRLAGEIADGVVLNWCSPEQTAWSRERIAEGAERVGRDPRNVKVAGFIRFCVNDDVELARQAYVTALLGYALGHGRDSRGRHQGYRAHFERMGFEDAFARAEDLIARGATSFEAAAALPDHVASSVGFFGGSDSAQAELARLGAGLDTAIVRVIPVGGGLESTRAVVDACKP